MNQKPKNKIKWLKSKVSLLSIVTLGILLFSYILFPIYYLVTMSFRSVGSVISKEFSLIVLEPSLDAWREVFGNPLIWKGLQTSALSAGTATVLAVLIGTPAAYGFSRYKFRGDDDTLFFILAQRMLPAIAIFMPYILIWKSLGIIGDWYNLIVPYVLISLPITVWLMYAYIDGIPREFEESARIEGCSQFEAFRRIILPNVLPGLIMTALFNFALLWNEYFFALQFRVRTLPVEVASGIRYAEVTPWPLFSAEGVLLMVIPGMFALYLQKRIREFVVTF